jgi:hypothetical protein
MATTSAHEVCDAQPSEEVVRGVVPGRPLSLSPAGLRHLQRTAGNQAVMQMLQRSKRGGVETREVVPELNKLLKAKKITVAREVTFELLDETGLPVLKGRTDLAFLDPSSGKLVMVEVKGMDLEALTKNQKVYVALFEGAGARIRITSVTAGKIGLHKGDVVRVGGEHFLRIGRSNLPDFADAIEQVTSGDRVKFRWQDSEGMRWFKTEEEFDEFLKSKGIERVKPAKGATKPTPAPVKEAEKKPSSTPDEDFPSRVARAHGARVIRPGKFVTIGGLVYAVMLIGQTKMLVDSVKANGLIKTAEGVAVGVAVESALARSIARIGGIGLVRASWLAQILMLEGDNPAQIEAKRRNDDIDDFIYETFPGVLVDNPDCWLGICLGGRYVVPDRAEYDKTFEEVGKAYDEPFVLEEEPEPEPPSDPDDCPEDMMACPR